jgi:hypothetical protein
MELKLLFVVRYYSVGIKMHNDLFLELLQTMRTLLVREIQPILLGVQMPQYIVQVCVTNMLETPHTTT